MAAVPASCRRRLARGAVVGLPAVALALLLLGLNLLPTMAQLVGLTLAGVVGAGAVLASLYFDNVAPVMVSLFF